MTDQALDEVEMALTEIVENRQHLDLHKDDRAMLQRALRKVRIAQGRV